MKLFAMLGGIAMLAFPGPATAQPQPGGIVTLAPDQAVIIRIGTDAASAVTLESRGAATLSELDKALVGRFSDPAYNAATSGSTGIAVNNSGLPEPTPVAPDRVRIALARVGDRSVLILENGYGQGLVYRARIQRGAALQATDVCLVMPMRRGYENWPYALDRIEISDIHFVPWRAGDPLPCA